MTKYVTGEDLYNAWMFNVVKGEFLFYHRRFSELSTKDRILWGELSDFVNQKIDEAETAVHAEYALTLLELQND